MKPFQEKVSISMLAGAGSQDAFISVPAGKRLVIEYLTKTAVIGGTKLPSRQQVGVAFQLAAGGVSLLHYLGAMTLLGTQVVGTPAERWVGSEAVKLYADPGPNTVRIAAFRTGNTNGEATVDVSISGQLVDLP